jgi:hypothetical protein
MASHPWCLRLWPVAEKRNPNDMKVRLVKQGERAVLPAPKAGWSMQTAECDMLVINLEPAERNAGGAVLSLDALKMVLRSREVELWRN